MSEPKENQVSKENQEPVFVQVNIDFLQAILDYMKRQPYEDVHMFIDVLTGKTQPTSKPLDEMKEQFDKERNNN